MKLTKEKTDIIIVRANTTDEYTFCDFAIIKPNRECLLDLYNRINTIYNEKDGYGAYYSISCPFYLEFYQLGSETEEIDDLLEEIDEKEWSYIEITEEELNSLEVVQDYSQGNSLKIDNNEYFWFSGWGKFSGVSYETSSINVKDL